MTRTGPTRALALAGLLLAACSAAQPRGEDPRALVLRFVEATNARDAAALDALLAPDFVRHCQATPEVDVRSRADMRAFLAQDAETFPDGRVTLERTVAEGDRVAFWGSYAGTQAGPMGPFPATGRAMRVDVSGAFRVADGRIAELWIVWDNVAGLAQLGHWPPPAAGGAEEERELRANEALARVWFERVINARDLDAIDAHYAPDYVHHGPGGAELRGIEAARGVAAAILAASADRVAVVEQQVAEGDLVVTRFTSRGHHTGPFRGLEPTGDEWTTEGICISRIEDGRIAEDWEIVHASGL